MILGELNLILNGIISQVALMLLEASFIFFLIQKVKEMHPKYKRYKKLMKKYFKEPNHVNRLDIQEKIFRCEEKSSKGSKSIKNVFRYDLFKFYFFGGTEPHLMITKTKTFFTGRHDLSITKISTKSKLSRYIFNHPPEKHVMVKIYKALGLLFPRNINYDDKKSRDALIKRMLSYTYINIPIMDELDIDDEDSIDILNLAATYGYYVDKRILTPTYSLFSRLNPKNPRDFGRYMKFMGIIVLFTNPSTCKSSITMRLTNYQSDASSSRMKGWSDAEKISRGKMDNQTIPFGFDEVNTYTKQNVFHGLLTILEKGSDNTAKGMGDVSCDFCSNVLFCGNPPSSDSNEFVKEDMKKIPQDVITIFRIMCKNFVSFSKRNAYLLFSYDLLAIDYNISWSDDEEDFLKGLTDQIIKESSINYNYALRNKKMLKWLNKPLPKYYLNSLNKLEEEISIFEIKQIINGLKIAKMHVRGMALQIGCTKCYNLQYDDFDEQASIMILNEAENGLNEILENNLETLTTIVENINPETVELIHFERFNNVLNDAEKIIVSAFCHLRFNEEFDEIFVPWSFIKKEVIKIIKKLPKKNYSTKKKKTLYSNVRKSISTLREKTLKHLNEVGLEYMLIDEGKTFLLKESRQNKIFLQCQKCDFCDPLSLTERDNDNEIDTDTPLATIANVSNSLLAHGGVQDFTNASNTSHCPEEKGE